MRDRFQEGGSYTSFFLAFGVIGGILLAAYVLTEWQRRAASKGAEYDNPRALLRGMSTELGVGSDDRRWIETVAKHGRVEHPAVLMISESLFDSCVELWRENSGASSNEMDRAPRLRQVLFHPDDSS
jgi:hypothetical protein